MGNLLKNFIYLKIKNNINILVEIYIDIVINNSLQTQFPLYGHGGFF